MTAKPVPFERAGMLAGVGYGRGLPVLSSWGLAVMDRMVDLVERTFRSSEVLATWQPWAPSMIRRGSTYRSEAQHTSGIETTFRFEWAGEEHILRPDAAVDGLRTACSLPSPQRPRAAFATYCAHRDLQGSCVPLNRDRAIWPVMQLNVVAPDAEQAAVEGALVAGLDGVFAALGLPTVVVDHGPWKDYARRRLDWVLAAPGAVPTVLAMAYESGDHFRALAGVPHDAVAWDVGLTGRPLRLLWDLAREAPRWVLPAAVAPVHAVVGASAAADELGGGPANSRTLVVPDDQHRWWADWYERGVPVLVGRSRHGRRCLVGAGSWEPSDEDVDALVSSISVDPQPVLDAPRDGGPGFEALCEVCAVERPLAAPLAPPRLEACANCGADGLWRLTASTEQLY